MNIILIVILVLVLLFVAASLALSRTTHEVENASDADYLELEGSWIRYRVSGGGPPVVLVHGLLSSSRVWQQLADLLAERFTVYTLDLSGFGDSDKPISGYGIRYGSRLLYAFCAYFGITRAAVVGHDIGGAMAVKLAANHPDVLGRLVLVATPANEEQIDLPTLLWLATLPVIGPVVYTLGRFSSPIRRLWMRAFVLDPEDLPEAVVEDAGKSTPAALSKTLSMMRREIAQGRLVRQAGIVKVPVLVIAGEGDQIVDPQSVDNWAQALLTESVLLDECGHMPMLERPREFNARVLAFLTGDPSYLRITTPEPPQEMEDLAVTETPEEEPPPLTRRPEPKTPEPGAADTGAPPSVTRKQGDARYPSSRDSDPEGAGGRPRDRTGSSGGVGGLSEVPEGLFEWPDSLKKSRPWDRPRETDWQAEEERSDEDAEPEDPEEKPRQ